MKNRPMDTLTHRGMYGMLSAVDRRTVRSSRTGRGTIRRLESAGLVTGGPDGSLRLTPEGALVLGLLEEVHGLILL